MPKSWAQRNPTTAAMVKLARARFKQADEADKPQRERERDDLAFYGGEQWDPQVKEARSGFNTSASQQGLPPVPARPTYTINRVREPVRQVLNQERQADFAVEIVAADDFGGIPGAETASPLEIELREGLTRRIQRESEAAAARSWAFKRAAIAGRGYYLITTEYLPGATWDQDIKILGLYDQSAVRLDPAHEQPDGSDMNWGFVGELMPWEEYKATWPKIGPDDEPNKISAASDTDFDTLVEHYPDWFKCQGETRSVLIVHYYYVTMTPKEWALLPDGSIVARAEVPKGITPRETRTEVERKVHWARLDGANAFPLDETEVPCPWVPIMKVVGEELQPWDEQRRVEGMVRVGRDAQKGANALISKAVEQIALTPIPQLMIASGQDEGFESEWQQMNVRNLPVLHYNQTDSEDRPAPPPTRPPVDPNIAPIMGALQVFNQAVLDTMGRPGPTNIQANVRSGEYLKTLLSHADEGSSGYLDNEARTIRHEGRCINAMLATVYGRPGRLARMVTGEKAGALETTAVPLHVPFIPPPPQVPGQPTQTTGPQILRDWQKGQPIPQGAKLYTLTPGANFNVTVKVSKSFNTRREQEDEMLGTILAADPTQLAVMGDLYFKYKDGPGATELSDRYRAVLRPEIQALLSGQTGPNPQLQALQMQVQQLQQALATKTAEIQARGQIELQKDQADNATKIAVAKINQEGAFAVASLKAQLEAANTAIAAMQEERLALESTLKETRQQVREHLAQANRQAAQQTHEAAMSQLEHQQAMQQTAQQAALQPSPQAPMNGADNGGV